MSEYYFDVFEQVDDLLVPKRKKFEMGNQEPGGTGSGISYSSDEVWTGGYWLDGKKIYRKTLQVGYNTASYQTKTTAHNIDNMDKVIDMRGMVSDSNNAASAICHIYPNSSSSTAIVGFKIDNNNISFAHNHTTVPVGFWEIYVTVEYTCIDR